ncbi:hypothetical protein Slin15195_G082720 [Septoria linicola]|uniref:Apple domain-containing protein n=1 Tax=Septoria linicola TaxID=215465 RepID=A0A9Q9AXE2_9PEZI|nr:hypothetical protein Slin14017_G085240 [Septoria linicola]USW54953.1 hypothetical protein Slin15195_G082720 [Septoria linicola]
MLATKVQLATLGFTGFAQAATGVCTRIPYLALLPLSNVPAATSFCSTNFPLVRSTATATSTKTSTVSTIVATFFSTTGTSTFTTTVATDYSTITTGTSIVTTTTGTDTITSFTSTSTSISATQTNTVCSANAKRDATDQASQTRIPNPAPVPASAHSRRSGRYDLEARQHEKRALVPIINPLLVALTAQSSSVISTACSCIETPLPPITTTRTTTQTSTTSLTATFSTEATSTSSVTFTSTILTDTTTTTTVRATTILQTDTPQTQLITTQTAVPCITCPQQQICLQGYTYAIYCRLAGVADGTATTCQNIGSISDCATTCRNRNVCNAFMWNDETRICTTFDNATVFTGLVSDRHTAIGSLQAGARSDGVCP